MTIAAAFDPTAYKDGMLDELKLDTFEVRKPSGDTVHPHTGESVWLLPYGMSLGDELKIAKYVDMSRAEAVEQEQVEEAFTAVCAMVSGLVLGWSTTDQLGRSYAQLPRLEAAS